ncbi:amidohydrolase family protein [Dongia deserti]|uniref:amidohydrolase family protein n=1 Tax=Dongia deserti TaxID=2268030 RepID=UPI000E649924|nr:amidohydrolase family protein [Dongia deserti]
MPGKPPLVRTLTGAPPRLKAPAGTCDTHIHFYSHAYPALPGTLNPPDATVGDYRQVMQWLGIDRAIVVQPNAYGDDNRVIMAGVKALGPDARAVVVVKPGVTDEELDRLTREGACGIRFMNLLGGTLTFAQMDEMAARVQPFGWSAVVQLDGRTLPEHEAQLRRLTMDYVIDHCGKFLEPVAPDHEAFRTLLRLVETGRCWVKIAAAYEFSKSGGPAYEDVARLMRVLIRQAPERVIWGTNWPHAMAEKIGYPNDAALLNLLLDWAPDEAVRHKILVDNPAKLYGFDA